MSWVMLVIAGLMEVGFAFCLGKTKVTSGAEMWMWWIGFAVALSLSMWLLSLATRTLPISTAYPVWIGIGAVGTVIVGVIFFNEPTTFWRLFFITTLILSVIGLKIV